MPDNMIESSDSMKSYIERASHSMDDSELEYVYPVVTEADHIREFNKWQQSISVWRSVLLERSRQGRQGVYLIYINHSTYFEIISSTTIIEYKTYVDFLAKSNGLIHSYKSRDTLINYLLSLFTYWPAQQDICLYGYELRDPLLICPLDKSVSQEGLDRTQHYRLWQGNGKSFELDKDSAAYRLHNVLDAYFALRAYLDQIDFLDL